MIVRFRQPGGVFWTKFEHFLSKTNNDSLRPATARFARSAKEKFCLQFFICARPIFSSKRKTKLFFVGLLLTSRVAGLRFGSGEAEFPPHPPSASPSLPTALFSADLKCVPISLARRLKTSIFPNHSNRFAHTYPNHTPVFDLSSSHHFFQSQFHRKVFGLSAP